MGRDSSARAASRDDRAKQARNTINVSIPKILHSTPQAKRGIESAKLIVDPQAVKQVHLTSPQPNDKLSSTSLGPKVTFRVADTLAAAHDLVSSRHNPAGKVAILNMASPLRPGGGVLSGATSQEEWLCARTTLYPSLREEFYRLPEVGGVYTSDVLVFRRWDEAASDLPKGDWFFVDVITAAMIRLPDVDGEGDQARYAEEKDRELAVQKMRAVLRMAAANGVSKLVLGAWGCGAYGNPVGEVAKGWRRVLLGGRRKGKSAANSTETWDGLEVVFAIKDEKMTQRFEGHFDAA